MNERCSFQFRDGWLCKKRAGHKPPHNSGSLLGSPPEPENPGARDMEAKGLAGTTASPVQGGGDTESERDVLESLRGVATWSTFAITRMAAVGAIAEIERLELSLDEMTFSNVSAFDAIQVLEEQLRQYTEAEVVWQTRSDHASSWLDIHESEVRFYTEIEGYETRALIVPPRGTQNDRHRQLHPSSL